MHLGRAEVVVLIMAIIPLCHHDTGQVLQSLRGQQKEPGTA